MLSFFYELIGKGRDFPYFCKVNQKRTYEIYIISSRTHYRKTYGFAPKIYDVTQEKISLSKMTFSHQMIRLIFVEQLYRAMTILNNGPYHHE